jgi:hypothetical protein
MSDFLSKISGQIAGSIILGAMFPVVLFVTAMALLVLPITPYSQALTTVVAVLKVWEDKASAALVISVVVLVLSVVLYMLNIPIIRLYEGYPWKQSWIGGKLQQREQKRFDDATELRAIIRQLRREIRMNKLPVDDEGLIDAQQALARMLNDEYPASAGMVLPTRLGNVIRSFETYSLHQYGLPAIAVWPRLVGVMPPTYAQGLDGAQTSFNFMLNCSFLSIILSALLTLCGLRWAHPFEPASSRAWIFWAVVFIGSWRLFYYGAIDRASEWGAQVKTALDLYRGTLLTQLGYDLKPETPDEERRIWRAINYKFSFPDDRSYPELPYKRPATALLVTPDSVVVSFSRTVWMSDDETLRVKIVIVNDDPEKYDASEVILRDDVSTGQTYIRDSCAVDGIARSPMELNPIRICIGKLDANESCTVTYKLKVPAKA